MKNNSSCAWYWHAFGIFFLAPPQAKQWVQATSRLGEPRVSFARGSSRGQRIHWSQVKDERSTVVRGSFCIAIVAADPYQWRWLRSRTVRGAATLVSTRSAPLSMLLSLDCLLHWGIPTELKPRSLKARDAVCADCSRLGPGFLEGIPGQPALVEKRWFLGAGMLLARYGAALTVFLLRRWRKPGSWQGTERPFTASPYLYYNSTSSPFSAWAVWKIQHYPGRSHPTWERRIEQLYHHSRCKAEPSAPLGAATQ